MTAQATRDISLHDATLLALRRWAWLLFVPLAFTALVTGVYQRFPARDYAVSVLNTDEASVQYAIRKLGSRYSAETSQLSFEPVSPNAGVLTAFAPDGQSALDLLRGAIDQIPPNLPAETLLTPNEALELRALKAYSNALESQGTAGQKQEYGLVQRRIRALELRDIPADPVPLIGREPVIATTRIPPTRNVIIFTFLAALFATWATVYALERRRLRASG